MAFLFAHEWIAKLVLQKIKNKEIISDYNNIDDYFFGAIVPDIRYVNNSDRELTHKIKGQDSVLKVFSENTYSKALLAGYETHLIVDVAWSNEKNWLNESIYEFYNIDANDPKQKYALYLLVDDYFQSEADWLFPLECAGYMLRANETQLLQDLGFTGGDIAKYKSLAAGYMREPGVDTFNIFNFGPNKLEEVLMRQIAELTTNLTDFLKDFKKTAIEKCVERLEDFL